ncbi:hypothetical protein TELCIR_14158, partial [Teladorsagia circumcincta]
YGGLALGYQNPNVPFDYGVGKRRSLRKLAVRHVSKILFDTRAFHSQPVHLNLWHNSLLRAAINRSGKHVNPGAYAIRLTNHPLPTGMVTFNVKRIIIGMPMYKSLENIEAFAVLMALFGMSSILMVYALFGLDSPDLAYADEVTRDLFVVFPPFSLGRGILDTVLNDYYNRKFRGPPPLEVQAQEEETVTAERRRVRIPDQVVRNVLTVDSLEV